MDKKEFEEKVDQFINRVVGFINRYPGARISLVERTDRRVTLKTQASIFERPVTHYLWLDKEGFANYGYNTTEN